MSVGGGGLADFARTSVAIAVGHTAVGGLGGSGLSAYNNDLRWVFDPNRGGGLYLPLVAYQDTGGVTPSGAVGETIALIDSNSPPTTNLDFTQAVAASQPRMGGLPKGRTVRNRLPNNMMTGAVAGSPGTAPTGWTVSTTTDGLGVSITHVDTTTGTIRIRFNGTSGAAGTVVPINFSGNTYVNALSGEVWTAGLLVALQAGTLTNVTGLNLRILGYTSGGATTGDIDNEDLLNITATPTLRQENITLSAGTTAYVAAQIGMSFTNSTAVDFTLEIKTPTLNKASSVTSAIQKVYSASNIQEDGYDTILLPYGDGGDSMSTGVVGFGTATQGLYAAAGQYWSAQALVCTFTNSATILAQCGATGASQMFLMRNNSTNTAIEIVCRGTTTVLTGTYTPGALNLISVVCDNGVVTARVNTSARESVTVGAAAAEAVAITFMARTATSPAAFNTGWGQAVDLADYAMSAAVEAQTISTIRALVGGP